MCGRDLLCYSLLLIIASHLVMKEVDEDAPSHWNEMMASNSPEEVRLQSVLEVVSYQRPKANVSSIYMPSFTKSLGLTRRRR